MAAVKVLTAKRDQEKHKLPDPLLFDLGALDDLPYSVSGAWEDELVAATGQGIGELLGGLTRGRAKSKVALVWLACKMADVEVPKFAQFDIAWRHVKTRDVPVVRAGDAQDPPAGGSSEPPLKAEQ